jgi:predicted GTPase
VVLEGGIRDMGSCYSLLNEVVVPNIDRDRILVAINQADIAMKGTHWDFANNRPDAELKSFLRDKAESVKRRVYEATGVSIRTPVCFSAETGYNVQAVIDALVSQIPRNRPSAVSRRCA